MSGLLHHGLAYVFYLAALRRINASSAAVSFDLVPIFGIAAGLVYGERLDAPQWVGAAVVIGAVALIASRERGVDLVWVPGDGRPFGSRLRDPRLLLHLSTS